MSEDKPKQPRGTPQGTPKPEPSDREARLAQALRDNLRRRKAAIAPQTKPKSDA